MPSLHKKKLMLVLIIVILSMTFSCKDCLTGPNYHLDVYIMDYSSDWISLKIELPDSGNINEFALVRDGFVVSNYTCYDNDTLIFDKNLTPDKEYLYYIQYYKNDVLKEESSDIKVHTLPTTSHEITWEVDMIGNYGSYFKDVAIIDENNIWVVGNIESDSGEFNIARWNGEKWILSGIYSNTLDLYSIQYFSEDDIWVTDDSFPIHWDGTKWRLYHIQNMGIDASVGICNWGTSSNNMFFAEYYGAIVSYNGTEFIKAETGTDTKIVDIYGLNENHVWATAKSGLINEEHPKGYESVVFFFNGENWNRKYVVEPEHTSDQDITELKGYMNSVWCYGDMLYISSHSGLWRESISEGHGYLEHGPDNILDGYPFLIRGTNHNDIFAFLHRGDFYHFNGHEWQQDPTLYGIRVNRAVVTEEEVVVVGHVGYQYAVIARGHRN